MRELLAICSLLVTVAHLGGTENPNIIVIMADDLGYGDLSCYGATALETPNIDRLAAEGQRFTSGYCSASTCTPTRYSFLTGSYAFREKGKGIAAPNSPLIIPPSTFTLPDLMQKAGYRTAVIGKWKLQRYAKKRTRNLVVSQPLANTPVPEFQLFDLSRDPAEKTNVIVQHPDLAERLKRQLASLIKAGRSR